MYIENASKKFGSAFSWSLLNFDLSTEQKKIACISLNISKYCLSPCEPKNRHEW